MIDASGEGNGEVLLDGTAILARLSEIDPVLRAHADETEGARRLSNSAVDALRWAGVFRMAMPRAWGGPEVDICTQVEIVERVARAAASAAWCAMIGSERRFFASFLNESAARRLDPDLDAVTAGFQAAAGTMEVCDGGYRLSGRWSFGSGVTHADVIMGGAIVMENGKPARHLATQIRPGGLIALCEPDITRAGQRPRGTTASGGERPYRRDLHGHGRRPRIRRQAADCASASESECTTADARCTAGRSRRHRGS